MLEIDMLDAARTVARTKFPSAESTSTWQEILKHAVREAHDLCLRLDLPRSYVDQAKAPAADFRLFVPEPFLARMRRGDPDDPLLRQVLPQADETRRPAGYSTDPLSEAEFSPHTGLLRKYDGRALIVATGVCAVHCRYCFRRHFPYDELPKSLSAWENVWHELEQDSSLHEAILSGGDPLMLNDQQFSALWRRLDAIRHIRRLRIHTRLPIMVPQRATGDLIDLIRDTRATTVIVIHANHPNELDGEVAGALHRLASAGALLLNQTVLLRGINDSADVLAELSERLVEMRVVPYYLHQLDLVQGAAHFEVAVARGQSIMRELRARLPGYAVPRYVQEIPGELSKVSLE